MNLQEELKALKDRITELEYHARKEKEFPQDGDSFYSISETGNIESGMIWGGYPVDMDRMAIGNVFETKEQAEFAAEKLKVEAELRKFSRPFEPMTDNFFMIYDKYLGSLENNCSLKTDIQGVIYFGSREEIQKAAETVGIERIKKYIFGVED